MDIEKIEAQRKQNKILRTRINWKINNQQFAKLNYLTYLGCMFRFDITDQAMMKKLNDFTLEKQTPYPIELCNFFLENDIAYRLEFKYDHNQPLRINFLFWKHVIKLNQLKKKLTNGQKTIIWPEKRK